MYNGILVFCCVLEKKETLFLKSKDQKLQTMQLLGLIDNESVHPSLATPLPDKIICLLL